MSAPRFFGVLVLLSGLLAAGCSGSGEGTTTPTPSHGGSVSAPSESPVTAQPGTAVYEYVNAGLTATMDLKGNTGTLEIVNKTGRQLPKPDFYILDARDATRIDGRVLDAAPVPDGITATFDVSFAPVIELKNIGFLVLLMGNDNYGGFVRR